MAKLPVPSLSVCVCVSVSLAMANGYGYGMDGTGVPGYGGKPTKDESKASSRKEGPLGRILTIPLASLGVFDPR